MLGTDMFVVNNKRYLCIVDYHNIPGFKANRMTKFW